MAKRQAMESTSNDPAALKKSIVEEREGMEDAVK